MISLYDITCVAGGLVRRRKILFLAQDDDASYTDQYDRLTKGWEIIVQVWQYMKLLVGRSTDFQSYIKRNFNTRNG